MSANDTDYDSDTSGETPVKPPRQVGKKCRELEVIQMALEDVMAQMVRIKRQITELENTDIDVTDRNRQACRNIMSQLHDIETSLDDGRYKMRNVIACSCHECDSSCHETCLRCSFR